MGAQHRKLSFTGVLQVTEVKIFLLCAFTYKQLKKKILQDHCSVRLSSRLLLSTIKAIDLFQSGEMGSPESKVEGFNLIQSTTGQKFH